MFSEYNGGGGRSCSGVVMENLSKWTRNWVTVLDAITVFDIYCEMTMLFRY
jgi:hypothetical protein